METLLFFIVQLIVQSLIGLALLAFAIAVMLGRILAMLLPVLFRAVVVLLANLARALFSNRRPEASDPWQPALPRPQLDEDPPAPFRRVKPPAPPARYSRRYTVRNFWRSGDK